MTLSQIRDLPIYLYSTRLKTDRFKHQVEAEILNRLAVNRDFEFRRILRHKTHSLVKSCLGYLDIALKTALQADQDRDALRDQILNEKVNEMLVREEMGLLARENQRQTRPLLQIYLDRFQAQVTATVIARPEASRCPERGRKPTPDSRCGFCLLYPVAAPLPQ
jgi:hypothetical protein